jgi:hypothetical protein
MRSAAAGLLGLRVQILPGTWMSVFVNVVGCQVEVSATSQSLAQKSLTECVCVLLSVIRCKNNSIQTMSSWKNPKKKGINNINKSNNITTSAFVQ